MRILVGLSGGFDSAYAAMLLINEGHTVEGAVLDMHGYTETEEAKAVALALGLPIHVISCRELFEKEVIENFCDAYSRAQTPNPCIICNEKVKFRVLYDYAMAHNFDRIATGHYARTAEKNGRFFVASAADVSKDQSYMLYRVPGEILEKLLLPMGNIIKKEAKEEGIHRNLVAADREESQDICFIKNECHADYIQRRHGMFPHGEFVNESGEVLGEHRGIIRYTVGQRKGLGVAASSRLFVTKIDTVNNRIVLSDVAPDSRGFYLKDVVFSGMTEEEALASVTLKVRVRYSARAVPAVLSIKNGELFATLSERAGGVVTPGQSAVFYDGGQVALGGIIEKAV